MKTETYLSQNLSWLMEQQKISAKGLSKATNIAIITIHKLKSGENINPTIETIKPIASYFGVTMDQLLFTKIINIQGMNIKSNNLIPMIEWNEISNFRNAKPIDYINCDYPESEYVYCIKVEDKPTLIFENNSILIIDSSLRPTNNDSVIVIKKDSQLISIKKVIIDDDWFLQSVTIGLGNSVLFAFKDYAILGVIVGQIKYFRAA